VFLCSPYILSDDATSSQTLTNTANGTEQSVQQLHYGIDDWKILFCFPAGTENVSLSTQHPDRS